MSFYDNLEQGKAGESYISKWAICVKKYSMLPVYEKIIDDGKGPQLFTPDESLVAPDFLAFTKSDVIWIEAKHKEAFTWWRKGQVFETGIDLRHYLDYIKVSKNSGKKVWLLFLHRGGVAKDSPKSPSGLFGNELSILQANESHRDLRWGKSGMVYWSRKVDGGALKYITSYENVINAQHE